MPIAATKGNLSGQRGHVFRGLCLDRFHPRLVTMVHLQLQVLLEDALHSFRVEVHASLNNYRRQQMRADGRSKDRQSRRDAGVLDSWVCTKTNGKTGHGAEIDTAP